MAKDKYTIPEEAKGMRVPPGLFQKEKGFETMHDVARTVHEASGKIQDLSIANKTKEERIRELESKLRAQEAAREAQPPGGKPGAPSAGQTPIDPQWGLLSTKDREERFAEDFNSNALRAVTGLVVEAFGKMIKPYDERLDSHDTAIADLREMGNLGIGMEEAVDAFGAEFVDAHQDEINEYIAKKDGRVDADGLLGMLKRIEKREGAAAPKAREVEDRDAAAEARGDRAGVEGTGDTEAGDGIDYDNMTAEEIKRTVPKGDRPTGPPLIGVG